MLINNLAAFEAVRGAVDRVGTSTGGLTWVLIICCGESNKCGQATLKVSSNKSLFWGEHSTLYTVFSDSTNK